MKIVACIYPRSIHTYHFTQPMAHIKTDLSETKSCMESFRLLPKATVQCPGILFGWDYYSKYKHTNLTLNKLSSTYVAYSPQATLQSPNVLIRCYHYSLYLPYKPAIKIFYNLFCFKKCIITKGYYCIGSTKVNVFSCYNYDYNQDYYFIVKVVF